MKNATASVHTASLSPPYIHYGWVSFSFFSPLFSSFLTFSFSPAPHQIIIRKIKFAKFTKGYQAPKNIPRG